MKWADIAREVTQEIIWPALLDERRKPRRILEITARMIGLPFEIGDYLRQRDAIKADPRGDVIASVSEAPGPALSFFRVCSEGNLDPSGRFMFEHEGQAWVLLRAKGQVFCVSQRCPHAGGPIHDGDVDGYCVTCPYHGWSFDLRNGQSPNVAGATLPSRSVQLRQGGIWVGPAL